LCENADILIFVEDYENEIDNVLQVGELIKYMYTKKYPKIFFLNLLKFLKKIKLIISSIFFVTSNSCFIYIRRKNAI